MYCVTLFYNIYIAYIFLRDFSELMHAQSGLGYILCVHASMHVHARACVYPMK